MFKFEKLDVWQKVVEYAEFIYKVTQTFPVEGKIWPNKSIASFGSLSILKHAEGSSRSSDTDLARFIEIAYGSLLESVSEIEIARRQGFLNGKTFETVYKNAEVLAKMLSGFRRSVKKCSYH